MCESGRLLLPRRDQERVVVAGERSGGDALPVRGLVVELDVTDGPPACREERSRDVRDRLEPATLCVSVRGVRRRDARVRMAGKGDATARVEREERRITFPKPSRYPAASPFSGDERTRAEDAVEALRGDLLERRDEGARRQRPP